MWFTAPWITLPVTRVAAERMIGGNLDKNNRDAVRVLHPHLDQSQGLGRGPSQSANAGRGPGSQRSQFSGPTNTGSNVMGPVPCQNSFLGADLALRAC